MLSPPPSAAGEVPSSNSLNFATVKGVKQENIANVDRKSSQMQMGMQYPSAGGNIISPTNYRTYADLPRAPLPL